MTELGLQPRLRWRSLLKMITFTLFGCWWHLPATIEGGCKLSLLTDLNSSSVRFVRSNDLYKENLFFSIWITLSLVIFREQTFGLGCVREFLVSACVNFVKNYIKLPILEVKFAMSRPHDAVDDCETYVVKETVSRRW